MAVDRSYILSKMRGRMVTPEEFNFDALVGPPLYSLLTPTDIGDLNKLATSIKYAGNPEIRLEYIDQIMKRRGFRKFTGGTNRVIYKFLEDDSFLVKVASDAVGVGDTPREWINQQYYKPFVTKVFEISPCGTVGIFERCIPITSREMFLSVASDIYDVIRNWFIGEYVCDDIGSDYFLNWCLRFQFGPVLCDFPYSYKLDGNKLYCNAPVNNTPGQYCGGVIDYDAGFNHLRCTKCGTRYKAIDLKKAVDNKSVIIKGGTTKMKVSVGRGNVTLAANNEEFLDSAPKLMPRKKRQASKVGSLKVEIGGGKKKQVEEPVKEEKKEEVEDSVVKEEPVMAPEPIKETVHKPQEDEPSAETSTTNIEDETYAMEEDPPYIVFSAQVTNTGDLVGDDEPMKCLVLSNEEGNLCKIGYENGSYIVVDSIMGKPLSSLAILDKKGHEELVKSVETSTETIKQLAADKKALQIELNEMISKYDKLVAEQNNSKEDDGLPYYIDNKGKKRDKKTNKFYKEPEPQEEEQIEFDTRSPLLTEPTTEQLKEEIEDKEIVKKIDEILHDVPEEESVEEEVPVGAAPPKGNRQSNKRSKRFDDDFYEDRGSGKGNKGKKSKK